MNLIFFLLLSFYDDFSVGGDFYRLPNYYDTTYREVININIDNFLDIKNDNFYFSSNLSIDEAINFDSLDKKYSYGYRLQILQAKEFQLTYNWKYFTVGAGRIVSWENGVYEPIDGYRLEMKYKFFKFSYLHGSVVTTNDFLGAKHYFDIYDKDYEELDYDVNFANFSFFYKNSILKIGYINYFFEDYNYYQLFTIDTDLNYKDFYLSSYFKREVNQNNENYKITLGYKKFGAEYKRYFPLLFNNSIFAIFSRSSYKRLSLFGKYKDFKYQFIGEELNSDSLFKYYGIKLEYKFWRYYKTYITYIHDKDLYIKFYSNNKIGTIFSFYLKQDKDFYSILSKIFYKMNLHKQIKLELYSTFLYDNFYSFQLRSGFFLNGSI